MSTATNKFAPDVHVRLAAQLVVDRLERAANLLVSDGYDHSGQQSDVLAAMVQWAAHYLLIIKGR